MSVEIDKGCLEELAYIDALRAWLRLEQALFCARGRKDDPEVVAARAEFEPIWDALSEENKQRIRLHPVDPAKVMVGIQPPQETT